MRKSKPFGKRYQVKKSLPSNKTLKDIFGITNDGCDSSQIVKFIEVTTGHKVTTTEDNYGSNITT